jgi:hypothetical protein
MGLAIGGLDRRLRSNMTIPSRGAKWRLVANFFVLLCVGNATLAAPVENVVFILSDDHCFDLMGFMDEAPDWFETPNLDWLAR